MPEEVGRWLRMMKMTEALTVEEAKAAAATGLGSMGFRMRRTLCIRSGPLRLSPA